MDLFAKLIPATTTALEDKEPLPVELIALQAEVKRLRAERATKEATEASLLAELQRRCNRVIALETELDISQSQARRLQQDCDKHTATQTQLFGVVGLGREGETGGSEGGSGDDAVIELVVALKARLATLEQERRDSKRVAAQQEEELESLRKQVEELKRVIVSSADSSTSSSNNTVKKQQKQDILPSAADLGLPEDVRLLLQRCPWTEAVLSNILVTEELYEWEGWSLFHGWSGAAAHLSQSTPQLQDMVLRCTDGSSSSSSSRSTYGRDDKTISDPNFNALVNPESVTLPRVGWEWLGGWRLDDSGRGNRGGMVGRERGSEGGGGGAATDAEGWSYGVDCEELIRGQGSATMLVVSPDQQNLQQRSSSSSSSITITTGPATVQKKRRVRRRCWVRVRILSSVPGASDMVNAFLSLHAQVATLRTLSHKLSEQVLSLQGQVNERETQAARAVGLDRELVAMIARVHKAERTLGQYQQRMARQEGEAKLKAALEGGREGREGGKEEEEGGGVKALGEAVSKWFAGLGNGEGRVEEGRKEGEGAKEGEEEEGGGFKKWISEVKSSLGTTNTSSSGVAVSADGEGVAKGAPSSPSIPIGTSDDGRSSSSNSSSGGDMERGSSNTSRGSRSSRSSSSSGGDGVGGAPLITNALRWFSKEVLQHTPNEDEDDPIESWAGEVADADAALGRSGGERKRGEDLKREKASTGMKEKMNEEEGAEAEAVPVERLSGAEMAALQKQLDEEKEAKEGKEGEGCKDEKKTSVDKTGRTRPNASSSGKKNKDRSQPKEQEQEQQEQKQEQEQQQPMGKGM